MSILFNLKTLILQIRGKKPKDKEFIYTYIFFVFLSVIGLVYLISKGPLKTSPTQESSVQNYKVNKKEYRKAFTPYISRYTPLAAMGKKRPSPCISGELVIIAIDNKTGENKISDVNFDLLKENEIPIARAPESIGTIVILRYGSANVGTYTDGASAYKVRLDITLYNKNKGVYCKTKSILGGSPPKHKTARGSRGGSAPGTKEIKKFLEQLPICNGAEIEKR